MKNDKTTKNGIKNAVGILEAWISKEYKEMDQIESQYTNINDFTKDYPKWVNDVIGINRVINMLNDL